MRASVDWSGALRTFAGVALASLVVWLFAAMQGLDVSEPLTLNVRFVAPEDGRTIVRVAGAADAEIGAEIRAEIKLRGSRGILSRASGRVPGAVVTLTPGAAGVPNADGVHSVKLAEALAENSLFNGLNVDIVSVAPPTVEIVIDRMRAVDYPIEIALDDPTFFSNISVEPAVAQVRGPASILDSAEQGALKAVIDGARLAALVEGATESFSARLELPEALAGRDNVSVTPARATVELTRTRRVETFTVPTVPVWVATPPIEMGRWSVTVAPEPFIRDVLVRGSQGFIQALEEGAATIMAQLALSSDELEARAGQKQALFVLQRDGRYESLPPGADVPAAPVVRYEATPIEPPASDTPPPAPASDGEPG